MGTYIDLQSLDKESKDREFDFSKNKLYINLSFYKMLIQLLLWHAKLLLACNSSPKGTQSTFYRLCWEVLWIIR